MGVSALGVGREDSGGPLRVGHQSLSSSAVCPYVQSLPCPTIVPPRATPFLGGDFPGEQCINSSSGPELGGRGGPGRSDLGRGVDAISALLSLLWGPGKC